MSKMPKKTHSAAFAKKSGSQKEESAERGPENDRDEDDKPKSKKQFALKRERRR